VLKSECTGPSWPGMHAWWDVKGQYLSYHETLAQRHAYRYELVMYACPGYMVELPPNVCEGWTQRN
jgi:hypothetical protein